MKPYLPNAVTYSILQWLPCRSLSRCRLVCKQWSIWIAHPSFVEQASYRSSRRRSHFVCSLDDDGDAQLFSIDNDGNLTETHDRLSTRWPGFTYFIHTCLELICMHRDGEVYLLNPTSRELVTLPGPRIGPSAIGFGYVRSTSEYKVVRVFNGGCGIATVKVGMHWRTGLNPPFGLVHDSSATFAVGALHFIPQDCLRIAKFDLETERWDEVPLPNDQRNFMALAELRDMLCVAEFAGNVVWGLLHIWMMKDHDARVWVNEYTIDLSGWSDMDFDSFVLPLRIDDDGRILIHHQDLQELYYYDPNEEIFSGVDNVRVSAICRYVDSFFSLQGIC